MINRQPAPRHKFQTGRAPGVVTELNGIAICGHKYGGPGELAGQVCVMPLEHAIHQPIPSGVYTQKDMRHATVVMLVGVLLIFMAGMTAGFIFATVTR